MENGKQPLPHDTPEANGGFAAWFALGLRTGVGRTNFLLTLLIMAAFGAGYFFFGFTSFNQISESDELRNGKNSAIALLTNAMLLMERAFDPMHELLFYAEAGATGVLMKEEAISFMAVEGMAAEQAQQNLRRFLQQPANRLPAPFHDDFLAETQAQEAALKDILAAVEEVKKGPRRGTGPLAGRIQQLFALRRQHDQLNARMGAKIALLKAEFDHLAEEDKEWQSAARGKMMASAAGIELLVLALGILQVTAAGRAAAANRAIGQEREKYKKLLGQAGDAVMVTDIESGLLTEINRKAEELLGIPAAEAVGRPHADFFPAGVRDEYQRLFDEAARRGEMETGNDRKLIRLLRRGGGETEVDVRCSVVALGGRRYIQAIYRDMTQVLASERMAEEQSHFLQRLIDAIPNPVYYKDTGGRFLGANHAFEEWFGVGRTALAGMRWNDVTETAAAFRYEEGDAAVFDRPGGTLAHERRFMVNGLLRDLMVYKSSFFNSAGKPAGLVAVLMDITERKEFEAHQMELVRQTVESLEEAQRERKKAEEANRLKSEFVANMSHELRTPLTSILGYSRIAMERLDEVAGAVKTIHHRIAPLGERDVTVHIPPGEIDEMAQNAEQGAADMAMFNQVVMSQGERLLQLINELLDLSMLESGQMKILANVSSARMILYSVTDRQAHLAAEKKIKLKTNMEELRGRDIFFIGDTVRLEQVLNNLAQNAIKYSDGGEVGITVALEGETVAFRVRDRGIGIAEADREAIFDAFRQLDGSTTRSQGGVGLGLTLAQKLVKAMGGSITLDSEVGKGSEFTVRLPYLPGES